jgi:hypothetical protein
MHRYADSDNKGLLYHRGAFWWGKHDQNKISWEWLLGSRSKRFTFEIGYDGEDGHGLIIGLPFLFTLYWNIYLSRFCRKYDSWTYFAFRIFEEFIWIDLWNDGDTWGRPRRLSIDWKEILLGRMKHTSDELSAGNVVFIMPEGSYPAKATITIHRWKYPRWFAKVARHVSFDFEKPIPIPDKEDSDFYDGDNAICSGGLAMLPSETLNQAMFRYRADILAERERNGGKNWKPETADEPPR